MGFEDHESFETKKIILSTHHGVHFQVKLFNAQSVTNFGCKNWEALCKMYGLDEGMLVTMDLGDPTIEQERPSILSLCEFLKHSYQVIYIVYFKIVDNLSPLTAYFHSSNNLRKVVDKTHYTDGSELTYKEKNHLIAYCTFLRITTPIIELLQIMVNTCH